MKKTFAIVLSLALLSSAVALACGKEKNASTDSKEPSLELASHDSTKAVFLVKGMMCSSCKKKIEASLKKIDGVKTVKFDLKKKQAEVTYVASKVETAALLKAVQSAGFEASEASKN